MKRLHVLILVSILTFGGIPAQAEVGGYRVEVIIFQNLLADVDAVEIDSLQSFANVPGLQDQSLPDALEVLTDRSRRMEGVWQRLRNSKGYRPLVYTSWVQNNIDYYPPFRIHDEVIIDTQIRSPGNIVVANLAAQDPLKAYRNNFYRLDGSAQLRLSRFLHINLNLEYRVPAAARAQQSLVFEQSDVGTGTATELAGPGRLPGADLADASTVPATDPASRDLAAYDIYRLKQGRQVKTDRLQYFDSPWFGALVLVIPIAAEPVATEPVQSGQSNNTN